MNLEKLEARITALEDIEAIKKLQRIYAYYVDSDDMRDEIVDLFSDNMESIEIADHGVYLGKEGVKKVFKEILGGAEPPPELSLHLVFNHQAVVDIDPGGKTAKGRWHGWMVGVRYLDGKPVQYWGHGIYENEYVKENGDWKFSKLYFNMTFRTPYEDGWLNTPVIGEYLGLDPTEPDKPPTAYHPYPSGYTVPYHWK
ncbi:nuclear transport factor 2 family protein [Thermodesulfobacteriota bacterium]